MATDNSQPRNRLIFVFAIGTVATLFVLKFVFDSYFTGMMETEAKAKQAQPEELWKLHEEEKKKLEGSPVPIQKAMGDLVSKGRESSPLIAPQPSDDQGPMVGWAQGTRAQAAPAAPASAGAAEHHDTATGGADAGMAATAGDAGVTTTTSASATAAKPDAGAAHAPAPAPH